MRELPIEFDGKGSVRGFKFTQRMKSDKAYLYAVAIGESQHYEVFRRKENKRFGTVSYPRDNAFGVWAWCIHDHARAVEKFNELNN